MKFSRLIVLTLAAGLMLTGCNVSNNNGGNNNPSVIEEKTEIEKIYALYQTNGGTLTYEEWLESIKGEDGTSLLNGNSDPSPSLGKDGDTYINTTSWDVFVKNNGIWTKIGNIMGQEGPKGDQGNPGENGQDGKDGQDGADGKDGQDGADGKDGTSILTGNGIPSDEIGHVGDSYINIDNWDYYLKNESGWVLKGNIKGETGSTGDNGKDGNDGLSAYEIYLKYHQEYTGTESEWIEDLINGNLNTNTTPSPITGYFSYANYEDGESYYISKYSGSDMYVTIPTTYNGYPVRAIGTGAFYGNNAIRNIVLNSNIISIGSEAFRNCSNLKTVVNTEHIIKIESLAFNGCTSLSTFEMYNTTISIGESAFSSSTSIKYHGSLMDWLCLSGKNNTSGNVHLFIDPNGEETTNIEIPNEVKTLKFAAFYGCVSLTSINLHDDFTSIGDKAFYGCSSLESIVVPDSVTSIGQGAFGGCTSLKRISLPFVGDSKDQSNSHVLGYIFGHEYYEGSVTITQYVNNNTSGRYYFPQSLKEVAITGGRIGYGAFYNCYFLTSITLPSDLTSISDSAFYNCNKLLSVSIPDSVVSIGTAAFYDCTSMTSIVFGDNLESIGDSAFYNCIVLDNVIIPDNVTAIGHQAFRKCSSLTSIVIGKKVVFLGNLCFDYCSSLTSITYNGTMEMWESVTKGTECFSNTLLNTIHCSDGDLSVD